MISTLRALFLARLLREKLLLLAFALILGAFWFSSFAGRTRDFFVDEKKTSVTLAEQAHWLSHRSEIESAAEKAASGFDAAKTLDSTALVGRITQLASGAGLNNASSNVPQEPISTGQFSFNMLDFNVTKADWDALKTFYYALQAQKPYIGIQQFVIGADRANPAMLTANLKISSVEIKQGGAQ